ncbi:MAG: protein kinase domain-containing protein [Pseudomarimonas sp.]
MIEIPGYRIVRALGRGGMATVYLAIQESVQREVALKVMSPTLHGDAEFGERFLREARIAASLRHRHVVQIHDVGRADDLHYMAMEYLSGGPVLNRSLGAGDLAFCLRVTREMALALDYAHKRGVIHRDIKPDNILLRDDGAAVLSDFGIARAQDNKRMTMTGTIMGTPHYMAPEQASGAAVDGRADLYSLGIVFHEMVVGVVPFDATDWVSVGLMHLSAPVPRLPQSLAKLQPLIDTMLAKDPAERLQTGADLAEVIADMEQTLSGPRSPPVKWPTLAEEPVAKQTATQKAAAQQAAEQPTRRREPALADSSDEPELGEIGQALSQPSRRGRRRNAVAADTGVERTRTPLWAWMTLPLLVLLLAYSFREPLRDLIIPSRTEELLSQAEQALTQGRLTGTQPPGASELFRQVSAVDPDNQGAREGLMRVAEALLVQARKALADDRVADAKRALAEARVNGAPERDIEAIETDIRGREQLDGAMGDFIVLAQAALASGRLDGSEDSALFWYAKALALDPTSSIALSGRRQALTGLLERARGLVDAGKFDEAQVQVDAVAAVEPAHLGLPEARGHLAEARQRIEAGVSSLIAEAEALLKQRRLISPAGNNARERYRSALAREPGNVEAQAGLRSIATSLLQQAAPLISDYAFDRAASLLDEAAATDANVPGLSAARARLRELQQSRGSLASGILSPEQQATVQQTLTAAVAAKTAGNLTYPPGESAWDLYRRVLSIEPNNATAKQGIAELPAASRAQFEAALGSNRLGAARGHLEGLQSLASSDTALPDMKRRLAAALIGYATERLGAGETERASKALEQAIELDPNNPEITSLRARLEQAG